MRHPQGRQEQPDRPRLPSSCQYARHECLVARSSATARFPRFVGSRFEIHKKRVSFYFSQSWCVLSYGSHIMSARRADIPHADTADIPHAGTLLQTLQFQVRSRAEGKPVLAKLEVVEHAELIGRARLVTGDLLLRPQTTTVSRAVRLARPHCPDTRCCTRSLPPLTLLLHCSPGADRPHLHRAQRLLRGHHRCDHPREPRGSDAVL